MKKQDIIATLETSKTKARSGMIKSLEYWQNSHDYEARKVRELIIKWLQAGADRHYNSEMEYLSAPETYTKATAIYGWRVGE